MSIYKVDTLYNPYNLKRAKFWAKIDPMSVAKNPNSHNDHNAGGQQIEQTTHQSVVLIGDLIIKGIVPQKLTRKKVYLPGKISRGNRSGDSKQKF